MFKKAPYLLLALSLSAVGTPLAAQASMQTRALTPGISSPVESLQALRIHELTVNYLRYMKTAPVANHVDEEGNATEQTTVLEFYVNKAKTDESKMTAFYLQDGQKEYYCPIEEDGKVRMEFPEGTFGKSQPFIYGAEVDPNTGALKWLTAMFIVL